MSNNSSSSSSSSSTKSKEDLDKEIEDARGLEVPDSVGSDASDPLQLEMAAPSRYEYLEKEILDQFRRIYSSDPNGISRIMGVVVSDDGGKSYRIEADSTETDRFVGTLLWSKEFVESEVTKATVPSARNLEIQQQQQQQQQKEKKE